MAAKALDEVRREHWNARAWAMKEMVRAMFAKGLSVEAVAELIDRLLTRSLDAACFSRSSGSAKRSASTARASSPLDR